MVRRRGRRHRRDRHRRPARARADRAQPASAEPLQRTGHATDPRETLPATVRPDRHPVVRSRRRRPVAVRSTTAPASPTARTAHRGVPGTWPGRPMASWASCSAPDSSSSPSLPGRRGRLPRDDPVRIGAGRHERRAHPRPQVRRPPGHRGCPAGLLPAAQHDGHDRATRPPRWAAGRPGSASSDLHFHVAGLKATDETGGDRVDRCRQAERLDPLHLDPRHAPPISTT